MGSGHRTNGSRRLTSKAHAQTTTDVIDEDVAAVARRLGRLDGTSVLVSGESGMLGRYLVGTLRAAGAHVVTAQMIGATVSAPQTHVDHVIHAEAPHSPDAFHTDPVGRISVNTRMLTQLLDIARRHKAHLTFVSSIDALENVDPLQLRCGYTVGQRAGEALCTAYFAQHEVSCSVVRLSHVYGPGMPLDDSRVHARIIRATLAGEPIMLQTDGLHERTYTYVADAAEAVLRVTLSGPQRETVQGFDVIDENGRVTIRELAHATLRAAGRPPAVALRLGAGPIMVKTAPPELDMQLLYELGWKPSIQLDDGLERTIRWHRAQT